MDKTLVGENKPKVHQLHKGYSELYKEKIAIVLLSQPQQQHNVTQPQHSCWVGHENDFANPTHHHPTTETQQQPLRASEQHSLITTKYSVISNNK